MRGLPDSTRKGNPHGVELEEQTTMAKHNRENAVRERRARKHAKQDARKQAAAASSSGSSETPTGSDR